MAEYWQQFSEKLHLTSINSEKVAPISMDESHLQECKDCLSTNGDSVLCSGGQLDGRRQRREGMQRVGGTQAEGRGRHKHRRARGIGEGQ